MDKNDNNIKANIKSIHDGHRKRMRQKFIEKGADSFLPHELHTPEVIQTHLHTD